MHFKAATVAAFIAGAQAFPALSAYDENMFVKRAGKLPKPNPVEIGEPNSGPTPNLTFDPKKQLVDVSPGSGHEWAAPTSKQVRGPCPGLNAAANHGFLPRAGILTLPETVQGLQAAVGFNPDFSIPLFFFSVFNSGSIIDEKWSIGGPFDSTTLGILGKGLGISNSHNKYDGDSSPGRGDAFLHGGDSHSLNVPNFSAFYHDPNAEGNYDLDSLRRQVVRAHRFTKNHNPYGFFGPTFFVAPIAHQFVVNMMSNHSAANPEGTLTPKVLKSFFAVKEKKNGDLIWMKGHDRIPENWYRRPDHNLYGIKESFADFAITVAQYPEIAEVGGNTGKPGTFTGVDFSDFTGGAFKASDFLSGDKAACFGMEALVFVVPGLSRKLVNTATGFFGKAVASLGKTGKALGCSSLPASFNNKHFKKYPGYNYNQPRQPATPY